MKNHLELTNCYEQRKRNADAFAAECRDIVSHIRKNRERNGIDIAALPIEVDRDDPNLLKKTVVVINTITKKCMLLKIQCDSKAYYWTYDLDPLFRTVEDLTKSRFFDRMVKTLVNKRTLDWEKFSENPFYALELVEVVA